MAGVKASPPIVLLQGMMIDELRALRFMLAGEKAQKPVFVTDVMFSGIPEETKNKGYKTGADFEEARRAILERIKNG